MFRSTTTLSAVAFITAALAVPTPTSPAKRAETITSSTSGTYDGWYWQNYVESGSGSTLTIGAGTMTVGWDTAAEDVVAGIGWSTGSGRTITYTAEYDADDDTTIQCYGWTTNPLVEYYIIDYVGSYNPGSAGTLVGSVTSDGGTYNIYETTRTNAPSIEGTSTFHQYLSVRTSNRLGGTITTQNHFNAWASHGLDLGAFNFQIMSAEGYESSGEVEITITSPSA